MNQNNLFAYMASVVSQLKEERRMGTAHVYQSTLRRVMEFEGEETLDFKDLTPAWLKSFQDHLLDSRLQWNTVSTYMRMLRAIYFRAVDDGVAPYRSRLFKGVYTGTKVTVKRAVGEETFRRLSAPVDDESLESARCLFLLLFMLRGIPFVDIAYMRRCDMHGNVIAYCRRKTGAWLTVRVEPEAMELIRRLKNPDESSPYLFPFISRPGNNEYRQYQNALRHFNYCLGRLARDMSGVEGLSSYSARHSWATIANFRSYQQELISNAMGHSSVKVTETYFKKHSDKQIQEMNRGILSYVFDGYNAWN